MQVKEGNTTITFSMDWIQPLMRSWWSRLTECQFIL
jgi:hypothetical protein